MHESDEANGRYNCLILDVSSYSVEVTTHHFTIRPREDGQAEEVVAVNWTREHSGGGVVAGGNVVTFRIEDDGRATRYFSVG